MRQFNNGNDNFGQAHMGNQPWDFGPQPWKPIQQGTTAIESFGGRGVRSGLSRLSQPQTKRAFNPFNKRESGGGL